MFLDIFLGEKLGVVKSITSISIKNIVIILSIAKKFPSNYQRIVNNTLRVSIFVTTINFIRQRSVQLAINFKLQRKQSAESE